MEHLTASLCFLVLHSFHCFRKLSHITPSKQVFLEFRFCQICKEQEYKLEFARVVTLFNSVIGQLKTLKISIWLIQKPNHSYTADGLILSSISNKIALGILSNLFSLKSRFLKILTMSRWYCPRPQMTSQFPAIRISQEILLFFKMNIIPEQAEAGFYLLKQK